MCACPVTLRALTQDPRPHASNLLQSSSFWGQKVSRGSVGCWLSARMASLMRSISESERVARWLRSLPVVAVEGVPRQQKPKAGVARLPLAYGRLKFHPALLHMPLTASVCAPPTLTSHRPCFCYHQPNLPAPLHDMTSSIAE